MTRFRSLFLVLTMALIFVNCGASAQSPLNETVDTTITGIADLFKNNFSSSQALGKPVEAGDFVFIPVVVKCAGFGFGTKLEAKDSEKRKDQVGNLENKHEDRIGLGAGAFVRPVALIVVKKGGDFQLIKLNEGFMTTLAKNMAPAMANVIKETIKNLFKMRAKKAKRRAKMKDKNIIIEKKLREARQRGPRGMMGPKGPMGPRPGNIRP